MIHDIKRANLKRQAGLTAVETLLAVLVLTLGILPLMSLLQTTGASLQNHEIEGKAILSGQNLLKEIQVYAWHDDVAGPGSAIGKDPGETTRDQFNDIDDFDAYEDDPDDLIHRSVDVDWVNYNQGKIVTAAAATSFKRVRVTVDIKGGGKSHHMECILPQG